MHRTYLSLLFALGTSTSLSAQAQPLPITAEIPASAKADFDAGQQAQAVEHDFPKAITLLTKAIDAAPGYAMAYGSRAVTYYQMGRYKDAAIDFNKALQFQNPPALEQHIDTFLGLTYRRLKQTDDAVRVYSAYLNKFGESWSVFMFRGEAYQEAGKYTRAQSDFDKALTISPDNAEVIRRKMVCFMQANDRVNALSENNRLLALQPNDANALKLHHELIKINSNENDKKTYGTTDKGDPIQEIINKAIALDYVRGHQIESSIHSSAALTRQLNDLVISGKLKEITILPSNAPSGFFGGAPANGAIRMRVQILDAAAEYIKTLHVDPVVFFLGYQGAKLRTQAKIEADEQMRIKNVKPNSDHSLDMTDVINAGLQAHAADDAAALITGWDDSFDATISSQTGPLSSAESIQLIREQPLSNLLIQSMTRPGEQLKIPTSFVIEINDKNVQAVAATILSTSNVK